MAQAIKIFQQLQANNPQVDELEESEEETGPAETSEMPPLIPDADPGTNFSLQRRKNKIWVALECLKEVPPLFFLLLFCKHGGVTDNTSSTSFLSLRNFTVQRRS